jgi:hypothetical protein
MINYLLNKFINIFVFIVFCLLGFLFTEVIIRTIDGYPVFPITLGDKPLPKKLITNKTQASNYLKKLPLKDNFDSDLFLESPPLLPKKQPDIFLMNLFKKAQSSGGERIARNAIREWNKLYMLDLLAADNFKSILNQYPPETVIFEPCDKNVYPAYRFPQNVTMPTGLVTNSFGWRGHELNLNKPANTIRVCFLGSSTTLGLHNSPYSYPEYIEHWLNLWAKKYRFNIQFEIMNTAREMSDSSFIAAIFRQEAAFLEPDIAIYYEGANQFYHYTELLKKLKASAPDFGSQEKGILFFVDKTQKYSATGRRLKELLLKIYKKEIVSEPIKPNYALGFPPGVDERNPDISNKNLPLDLCTILKDLDTINKDAHKIGCQFILTSFVYLPYKGLLLDRTRHQLIYDHINGSYWPLTYDDIKRLAAFQNRAYYLYAIANQIDFIDVSYFFPRDPNLFIDTIHFSEDGTRLQAWIVFQALLPIIRKRIESGNLPRPDHEYITEHPCIHKGIRNGLKLLKDAANDKEKMLKQ